MWSNMLSRPPNLLSSAGSADPNEDDQHAEEEEGGGGGGGWEEDDHDIVDDHDDEDDDDNDDEMDNHDDHEQEEQQGQPQDGLQDAAYEEDEEETESESQTDPQHSPLGGMFMGRLTRFLEQVTQPDNANITTAAAAAPAVHDKGDGPHYVEDDDEEEGNGEGTWAGQQNEEEQEVGMVPVDGWGQQPRQEERKKGMTNAADGDESTLLLQHQAPPPYDGSAARFDGNDNNNNEGGWDESEVILADDDDHNVVATPETLEKQKPQEQQQNDGDDQDEKNDEGEWEGDEIAVEDEIDDEKEEERLQARAAAADAVPTGVPAPIVVLATSSTEAYDPVVSSMPNPPHVNNNNDQYQQHDEGWEESEINVDEEEEDQTSSLLVPPREAVGTPSAEVSPDLDKWPPGLASSTTTEPIAATTTPTTTTEDIVSKLEAVALQQQDEGVQSSLPVVVPASLTIEIPESAETSVQRDDGWDESEINVQEEEDGNGQPAEPSEAVGGSPLDPIVAHISTPRTSLQQEEEGWEDSEINVDEDNELDQPAAAPAETVVLRQVAAAQQDLQAMMEEINDIGGGRELISSPPAGAYSDIDDEQHYQTAVHDIQEEIHQLDATSTSTNEKLVDHVPALTSIPLENRNVIANEIIEVEVDQSTVALAESEDLTRDTAGVSISDGVFEDESEIQYGPVVDHTPKRRTGRLTRAQRMMKREDSLVVQVFQLEQDIQEDENMEDGWEEGEETPMIERDNNSSRALSYPVNFLLNQSIDLEQAMVDHTPDDDSRYASMKRRYRTNDSTNVLADFDASVFIEDANEDEDVEKESDDKRRTRGALYGPMVDQTPSVDDLTTSTSTTPIASIMTTSNSLAVNVAALEDDYRQDDAMEDTIYADSTTLGGGSTTTGEEDAGESMDDASALGDAWIDDDDAAVEDAAMEKRERPSAKLPSEKKTASFSPELMLDVVDHTPSELPQAPTSTDPSIIALANDEDRTRDSCEGVDEVFDDENELEFGPVVDLTHFTPGSSSMSVITNAGNSMAVFAANVDSDIAEDERMDESNDGFDGWDEAVIEIDNASGHSRPIVLTRDISLSLVDHTPSELGPSPSSGAIATSPSVNVMAPEDETENAADSGDDNLTSEVFGPVVDHTPPTPAATEGTRSDSVAVQAPDVDTTSDAGDTSPDDEGERDGFDQRLTRRPHRLMVDQVVDRVPTRPESRFGDASTMVAADPSEILSEVDDLAPEEQNYGPVVDVTPPTRAQIVPSEQPTTTGSTVANAPSAADDFDDADETEVVDEPNEWDDNEVVVEEEPNPQSGNDEPLHTRVNEQLVDFLPLQDEAEIPQEAFSEMTVGGAQSLLQAEDPKEDDFGPVVDQTPTLHSFGHSQASLSVATQVSLSEIRALEKEDRTDGDDISQPKGRVVVDHLPRIRDRHLVDSIGTLGRSQLSEDDEEEDDSKFGPVVDQLPTPRAASIVSRGGSTVDALATVSEVDDGDGDGWDDDVDLSVGAVSDAVGHSSIAASSFHIPPRGSPSVISEPEKSMSVRFDASVDDAPSGSPRSDNQSQYYDPEIGTGILLSETQYYDPESGETNAWDGSGVLETSPAVRTNNLTSDFMSTSFAEADTPPSTPYRRYVDHVPDIETDISSELHAPLLQTTYMPCDVCSNARAIDCPCVQNLIKSNRGSALVGKLRTPDGDVVEIDFDKLIQDEVLKRRLIEEEVKSVRQELEFRRTEESNLLSRESEFQERITELRRSNDTAKVQISSLERDCVELRQTKDRLFDEVETNRFLIQKLQGTNSDLSAKAISHTAEIKELKAALETTTISLSTNSELALKIATLQSELAAKSGESEELRASIAHLQKRLASSENWRDDGVAEMEREHKNLKDRIFTLEKQLLTCQHDLADSQRTFAELCKETERKQRQTALELNGLQLAKESMTRQLMDLEEKHEEELQQQYKLLDKKTADLRSLEVAKVKLESEKAALAADLFRQRTLAEQTELLATELLSVAKERDLLRESLLESKETIVELQKLIDESGMEREAVQSKRDLEYVSLKVELRETREVLSAIREEASGLKGIIASTNREKESLQLDVQLSRENSHQLETNLTASNKALSEEKMKVETATREIQNLKNALSRTSLDKEQLEEELDRNSKHLAELGHSLRGLEDDARQYKSQVESLNSELTASKDKLQHASFERESLAYKLSALSKAYSDLEARHASTSDQFNWGEEKIASLQAECGRLREELDNSRVLAKQLDELRVYLQQVVDERDQLNDENEDMLVQFGLLKREMDASKKQTEESSQQIVMLQEQLRVLSEAEGRNRQATVVIKNLNQSKADLISQVEAMQTEKNILENNLQQLHGDRNELQARLTGLQSDWNKERDALTHEYEQCKEIVRDLESQCAILSSRSNAQVSRIAELTDALQNISSDYDASVQQKLLRLDEACKQKDAELELQRVELQKLRERIATSDKNVEMHSDEAYRLKNVMRLKEQEIQESAARVNLLEQRCAELEMTLNSMNRQVATSEDVAALKKQIESLSSTLHSTRARLTVKEEEVDKLNLELTNLESQPRLELSAAASPQVNIPSEDLTDEASLRSHVVSLALALERSENKRAEAVERLLGERERNAESLRRLGESVKRFYSTVSLGDS